MKLKNYAESDIGLVFMDKSMNLELDRAFTKNIGEYI